MPDPVSWLLIRTGWKVYASDGSEAGEVDEVVGDDTDDIFDGLAIATSAMGQPRYVPGESVGTIYEGEVHLTLTAEQVAALDNYLEPATTAEIEPDDHGGVGAGIRAEARKLEGEALAPTQKHEHPMNFWRRLSYYFRRKV